MSNCIAIPIKNLTTAKTRLSAILTPSERALFASSMFQDVFIATKNTPEIEQIIVVTPEGPAANVAREGGATLLLEGQTDGLNKAVQIAIRKAEACKSDRLLVLHADLPLVRPHDLSNFFQDDSRIMIAPSRDLNGTNALLLSPPGIIKPRYGQRSFDTHLALARQVGIEPMLVTNNRLGLDVDTPADLLNLCKQKPGGFTGEFLRKHGLEERLQAKDAESLRTIENQAILH